MGASEESGAVAAYYLHIRLVQRFRCENASCLHVYLSLYGTVLFPHTCLMFEGTPELLLRKRS